MKEETVSYSGNPKLKNQSLRISHEQRHHKDRLRLSNKKKIKSGSMMLFYDIFRNSSNIIGQLWKILRLYYFLTVPRF